MIKVGDESISWQGNVKNKGACAGLEFIPLSCSFLLSKPWTKADLLLFVETSGLLSSIYASLDEMVKPSVFGLD